MPEPRLSVVIHGHFYQPPREDPWLEEVERQPTASPFHDWNARIENECYRAVVAARLPGKGGRIREVVNTLEAISFNFGPTLLAWMEAKAPRTYEAVLAADRRSCAALSGHGNAIAQPYHHTILPLASRREKVTEVRWGLADFRNRFQREPEGMWLPETAADEETLDVLAQEGLAFTVLAPHQAEEVPGRGMPGLFRGGGNRDLAVFIYDGPISHGVAFGALLKDAALWARSLVEPEAEEGPHTQDPDFRLVSIATDGETYGHHHPFGEMALAAVLEILLARQGVAVENFASFLARHPPREEVRLVAPSSWSCVHGVERWRSDCGCKMHPGRDTQQAWRSTLRDSMDWLAGELHAVFEADGRLLFDDPWEARNRYGEVSRQPGDSRPPGTAPDKGGTRARELLEMERNALRLFTSCGWFFDDLAGIESLQVLRYAARALELAGPGGERLEEGFLDRLNGAATNELPARTGRALYLHEVKPRIPAHVSVAAGHGVLRALGEDPGSRVAGYASDDVEAENPEALRVLVTHRKTGRGWWMEVLVERPRLGFLQIRVRVEGESEAPVLLALEDLPDGFRIPAEEIVREAIVSRWIPPSAREGLLLGRETLPETATTSLVAALREFPEDPSDERTARVIALADLFQLLQEPVPFDAQTEFHQVLRAASPELATRLGTLSEPLGCVTTP